MGRTIQLQSGYKHQTNQQMPKGLQIDKNYYVMKNKVNDKYNFRNKIRYEDHKLTNTSTVSKTRTCICSLSTDHGWYDLCGPTRLCCPTTRALLYKLIYQNIIKYQY